ncbi:hypothetical protein QBC47DRAFT_408032 [Echria macrotheca]|uniref:Uncharacterized protein n=1 Tax=Echria macrotheca TaxID=438768 RepID=A0AAJ0F5S6_9PEZI|nr:hypothetical protein QBC47DRAFT_408032 [Echria macrotheca]
MGRYLRVPYQPASGDLLECANSILLRADSCGCLVLIRKLVEASETDLDLHHALVNPDIKDPGPIQSILTTHQSVGEAAFEGHADIVRFLCEHPGLGLESNLHYVHDVGHTVFHQAVRSRRLYPGYVGYSSLRVEPTCIPSSR